MPFYVVKLSIFGSTLVILGQLIFAKVSHIQCISHAQQWATAVTMMRYRAVACFWPPVSRIWHTLAVLSCWMGRKLG